MLIKTRVRKMTDAEARKISLVKHGASRIPFRVVKSAKNTEESGMFNLSRVFKNEDASTPARPEAVALVVQKADSSEELKAKFEEVGFEVGEVVDNDDGTVSYIRKGENLGDNLNIVRQSDRLLVVMKGFNPYTEDLTDFAEIAKSQGFYSGIRTACNILSDTLANSVYKTENPQAAADGIGTMVDAFRKYVVSMASSLPAVAFKADSLMDAIPATELKSENKSVPVTAPEHKESSTEAVETSVKEMADGKPAVDKPASDTEAHDGEEIRKALKSDLDKIIQSLDSVRNEVAEVKKSNETLQTQVKDSISKSEALEAKLSGTVLGAAPNGDQPSGTTVTKSEEFEPIIDTAFMQRSKQYR